MDVGCVPISQNICRLENRIGEKSGVEHGLVYFRLIIRVSGHSKPTLVEESVVEGEKMPKFDLPRCHSTKFAKRRQAVQYPR